MLRSILVPVDGSESSIHALKQVLPLARAERSVIRAISVVPPYQGELRLVGVKQHVSDLLSDPYRRALELANEAAEAAGAAIYTILDEGEPHEKIVEAAEAHGCELIVMGVRGHNPAEEFLMGSITQRVIGYSHTDVLVVPVETELRIGNLLVAVDGSEAGDRAVRLGFDFQRCYGSRLEMISVADVPSHLYGIAPEAAGEMVGTTRQYLERVKSMPKESGFVAEYILVEGNPAQSIVETAQKHNSGLIIMGSHGRTGLKRLLMGSVTERVVGRAPCPVLVARI
ncbi:MAG: universal stress protein [Desulfomonile sp.]|nr:universal stress protein [Desulfomonile sp.]